MIKTRQINTTDLIGIAAQANAGNTSADYGVKCREFVVRLCGVLEGIGQEEEARELAAALGMSHIFAVKSEDLTDWSAS